MLHFGRFNNLEKDRLRHLWVSIGTTTYIYICMHIYMYVCMYVCMYIYIFKSILQSWFLKAPEFPAIDQAWSKLHSNMVEVHQFCPTSIPAVALLQCRICL